MPSRQLSIIVGVTGGIAAYKAIHVVRSLTLRGHEVTVVPTRSALEFVGKPTFEAVSHRPVRTSLWERVETVQHVSLGKEADLVLVVPATANTLAKAAAGLADDLLTTTLLTTTAPIVLAPAMHTEMWRNRATEENVATLRRRGITVIEPDEGQLTGDDIGPGRLPEPERIVEIALAAVPGAGARDLEGRHIVVTAGGTHEALDPVRYLGNNSSGKQGIAFAAAAAARGARVSLVAANIDGVGLPGGVEVIPVVTADELAHEVLGRARGADAVVMAAAVADYRPSERSATKLKKDILGDAMTVRLVKNRDVLASLVLEKSVAGPIIGFAAETADGQELLELGRQKMARKKCDYLVLNAVGESRGFGRDTNTVVVIDRAGAVVAEASGTKRDVADRVLDLLA